MELLQKTTFVFLNWYWGQKSRVKNQKKYIFSFGMPYRSAVTKFQAIWSSVANLVRVYIWQVFPCHLSDSSREIPSLLL